MDLSERQDAGAQEASPVARPPECPPRRAAGGLMREPAEQTKYSIGPVYSCTCGWIVTDTGTGFRSRRVQKDPKCPVHGTDGDD